MIPIKDVNPKTLVEETVKQIIEDKRKTAAGLIKKLFYRVEQLQKDINDISIQKDLKEKKLEGALQKIEKIKTGDWSILREDDK